MRDVDSNVRRVRHRQTCLDARTFKSTRLLASSGARLLFCCSNGLCKGKGAQAHDYGFNKPRPDGQTAAVFVKCLLKTTTRLPTAAPTELTRLA